MTRLDVSERAFENPATDLALTLDVVAAFVRRFVVLNAEQLLAVTLWIFHTWAFEAADSTPYLSISSAEKRSGKTQLLEVLEMLAARPLLISGTTAAALARAVAQDPPPSLLLDESDQTFKRDREYVAALMGVLNAGYRRGGQTLLCLPPKWEVGFLPVFAPKAIAGIGSIPDTVADRSIAVRLERRTRGETIDRFRRRDAEEHADLLRQSCDSLATHHLETLRYARPGLPDELDDRAQDVWEPLLAIADLAGGNWPRLARHAAVTLSSGEVREDESLGARLLQDIHDVFHASEAQRYLTADLIAELSKVEESPWGDWHGKPITAQALSKLLRPYRIKTMPVKVDGVTVRGYKVEQFTDAFHRVLGVTGVTGVTSRLAPSAAGNASNASNAYPGDDGFLDFIAAAHRAGHITTAEALEREQLHRLVLAGRAAA